MESSSLFSDFVALRIAKEWIVALRYKLRMFGVPIRGPTAVLCDTQGVVENVSLPESTLTKRHNAINYHAVREATAAGIMRVGKEDGDTNLADACTKALQRPRRYSLFSRIGYSSMFSPPPMTWSRTVGPSCCVSRQRRNLKITLRLVYVHIMGHRDRRIQNPVSFFI